MGPWLRRAERLDGEIVDPDQTDAARNQPLRRLRRDVDEILMKTGRLDPLPIPCLKKDAGYAV